MISSPWASTRRLKSTLSSVSSNSVSAVCLSSFRLFWSCPTARSMCETIRVCRASVAFLCVSIVAAMFASTVAIRAVVSAAIELLRPITVVLIVGTSLLSFTNCSLWPSSLVTVSSTFASVFVSRPVISVISPLNLANSSLIHSDRVLRSGVTPNPSRFGGGISGEGWAPACL